MVDSVSVIEDLLPELIVVIAGFLDEGASRFCFSLVNLRFDKLLRSQRIDGFAFTRICALHGYLDLLKWSTSLNCPLHPQAFQLFSRFASPDALEWFWSTRGLFGEVPVSDLHAWIQRGGKELVDSVFQTLPVNSWHFVLRAVARSGFLSVEIKRAHANLISEPTRHRELIEEVATSGQYQSALSLCATPKSPSLLERTAFRCGVLASGDLAAVRSNFDSSLAYFLPVQGWQFPIKVPYSERHLAGLAYLIDDCLAPADVARYMNYLISISFAEGSICVLQMLYTKYKRCANLEIMTRLISTAAHQSISNPEEVFQCIKYSTEVGNISWQGARFRFAEYSFFSQDQLEWLCSRGLVIPENFEIDLFKKLERLAVGRSWQDRHWLEFIFQRGGRVSDEGLLYASKNHSLPFMEDLVALSSKYGTSFKFSDLYFTISDVLKSALLVPPIRYAGMLKILDWFASKGLAWDNDKIPVIIAGFPNKYFLKELERLRVLYER